MRRLFAFLALLVGLVAVVAPAEARMCYDEDRREMSRDSSADDPMASLRDQAEGSGPLTNAARRERNLGKPTLRGPFRIVIPTVMLADRTRE